MTPELKLEGQVEAGKGVVDREKRQRPQDHKVQVARFPGEV